MGGWFSSRWQRLTLYRGRLLAGVNDTLPEDVALAVDATSVALRFFDRPKSSVSFVATRSQVKISRWAEKADRVARSSCLMCM